MSTCYPKILPIYILTKIIWRWHFAWLPIYWVKIYILFYFWFLELYNYLDAFSSPLLLLYLSFKKLSLVPLALCCTGAAPAHAGDWAHCLALSPSQRRVSSLRPRVYGFPCLRGAYPIVSQSAGVLYGLLPRLFHGQFRNRRVLVIRLIFFTMKISTLGHSSNFITSRMSWVWNSGLCHAGL